MHFLLNFADSAIEKRLDEEKEPRLEMLLKKVNQEKLILDTVEENRRQLESVCLESDSRLTGMKLLDLCPTSRRFVRNFDPNIVRASFSECTYSLMSNL